MISETLPQSEDNVIVTTRTIHFPIEKVFNAWSDRNQLATWWGPNGFTNTFHEFDFRVGGKWIFTMHGPEVGHYENACEFLEIEAPKHIAWKRLSQPLFNVVFDFESIGEHATKVVFRMIFDTASACRKLRPYVVDKNEENFDRLEKELQK